MEQELTFQDLGLSEEILKALEKKGYGYPTRVQAEAIPPLMEWKDVRLREGENRLVLKNKYGEDSCVWRLTVGH